MNFPRITPTRKISVKHILVLLALIGLVCPAAAQEDFDKHPATKVVREYLNHILKREWEKSAALVEPKSLETLVKDYAARVKRAPTMDDERAMCDRLGKTSPEQIEEMSPVTFYVTYHKSIQDKYKVTPELMKTVQDSLKMRLLSIGEEDADHVHVLVRTTHSNGKVNISNLEMVSLVKVDGAWKVGLNEQAPRVTPIGGAAEGGADAPAAETKKPETKPAAAPAKETPAPKKKPK